jgi:hypothetical protein
MNFKCMSLNIEENEYLKNVINGHAKTILELQTELNTYKEFYKSIVDNNVINDKFEEYNNLITTLQSENNDLKQKLKIN